VTRAVTGATRVAGIIGDPVAHSRSPRIHNAAYAAIGIDWVYVAFRVRAGSAQKALVAARTLGLAGLNVTMPHKSDAAQICDELSDVASVLGVVNTVVVRDGRLLGDSTDGPGFVATLDDHGVEPRGRHALVVGAGGAARAIALALGTAGARVTVTARSDAAARSAAALAPNGQTVPWARADDAVAQTDLIVNATPLGMRGEPPPFGFEALDAHHTVCDTVYEPRETPLLAAARARGAAAIDGVGMLVHQAGLSFRLLTGVDPPLEIMFAEAQASE